jgi:hypothetical protein
LKYIHQIVRLLILQLGGWSTLLTAQFSFQGRPVQIHGFGSQGFAKSDNNNYLTMNTSSGTFAFTDGGVNATMQVTNRFRIGAQVYVRDIGTLGGWHPTVDWAVADYTVNDWLGLRGGKVKTVFGLYNDSQDMAFLHTWAILPQSLYPLDIRSSTIAHLGGDLYGEKPLKKGLGSIAYTAFAGRRFDDKYGGYRNVAEQAGARMDAITGWMSGGDVRWINPTLGLTLGASWLRMPFTGQGTIVAFQIPAEFSIDSRSTAFYVDYLRGGLHVTGEYSRSSGATLIKGVEGLPVIEETPFGWYGSVAYRISSKLEIGTYHSRFISDTSKDWNDPSNHVIDQTITARIDINRHWSVKVEGHIMDGYGSVYSARGFYLKQNPGGFDRKTNLFVLRAGYRF